MAYPPRTNAELEAIGAGGHEAHAQDVVDLDANIHTAPQAITGAWDFNPPPLGTINEFGEPSEPQIIPITIAPKGIGTAALNILKWDGTPPAADDSRYGVAHIDSDGGAGFAGERFTISEAGHVNSNGGPGATALTVSSAGVPVFSAGTPYGLAMSVTPQSSDVGLALFAANGQTGDMLQVYKPELDANTFRVTADGEVHAPGGVVLTSPDGTAFRITVGNDGTITATPA